MMIRHKFKATSGDAGDARTVPDWGTSVAPDLIIPDWMDADDGGGDRFGNSRPAWC
jgi:hypothetical protein